MADPFSKGYGVHFNEPWQMTPRISAAADYSLADAAGGLTDGSTVAFFTELANRGATSTTDWTANTYKTIVNLSGKGLCAAIIGPTSAGADITTVEITVDGGTAVEYPILSAAGARAAMTVGYLQNTAFTTAPDFADSGGALNGAKTILGDGATSRYIPAWDTISFFGTPCLMFRTSLLVRAKHAQNITNATATSYSGVMYRMGLA